MIILDGSWWCGGNKQRGIGRYLDAFFRFEFNSEKKEDLIWVLPDWSSQEDRQSFIRNYAGQIVLAPTQADSGHQHQWWLQLVDEKKPKKIWLTSAFERPWSLLSLGKSLFEPDIPVSAVVFDLLPLEYSRTILETWSSVDQQDYQERVELLQQVDHFVAISPYVKRQLVGLLYVESKKIHVPEFGLECSWIEAPNKKVQPHAVTGTHPLVVTLSGGEWRKNLPGTLRYFARGFSHNYRLVIVCRLGWKEHLRLRWLAFQLGILHRVTFTNFISEEEKWEYLYRAEVGLFLSRAEGLGIPLLEYTRASIPRIVVSRQLERDGFGQLLPPYYEIALEK